ncbi:MAG: metal ABC transporter ATP-binding protein [Anaerolineae bacterium]|nr:metal ABC transporter ATP-binding protein [Anaerolineae bacterium]
MKQKQFWKKPLGIQHAPHQPGTPILAVTDLAVRYNGHSAPHFALQDVTFELHAGEQVALVGPNGAGKSTLLKALAGVLAPTRGQVKVYGHGPEGHICIAYVPQRSLVDWTFPVTVSDVVLMGRIGRIGLLRQAGKADHAKVRESLELVGVAELAKRQIAELSGGQQQRMFIARALAQEAELMLMDEPLTGLDVPSQEEIFKILHTLRERHVTAMLSTHDLNQAAEHFDRVMLLNRKLLGFGAPAEVFTEEHLRNAYGSQMRLLPVAEGILALGDTCCGGDRDHTCEEGHTHG